MTPAIRKKELISKLRQLLFFALLSSCSAGAGDESSTTQQEGSFARDAASCADWKDAYCGWMEDCGAVSAAACHAQVDTVICKSNGELDRCARELSASCEIPSKCDAQDVADTATARDQCERFLTAYCDDFMACNPTNYAEIGSCVSAVNFQIDCPGAYAISESYDDCLEQLNAGGCLSQLPASCNQVIFTQ